MNDRTLRERDADEQRLAEIIRRAGARVQPDDAAREAVRGAVHAEWRAVVAERQRQRTWRWSLAAAAVVAALGVWVGAPLVQPPGAVMASVTRVNGPVAIGSGAWLSESVPAAAGAALTAGTELRSGAGGRVALAIGGASVRLDQDSTIRLAAADRIVLRRGAVYVDTGAQGEGVAPLRVETPLGMVEHLGTQYETRLLDGTVRLMVREGKVRLRGDAGEIDTVAGERVTLRRDGEVRRAAVSSADEAWAWAGEVAPAFDIENRSLPEFLRWVSRETGRDVGFVSAAAEQAAAGVVLRGSVAGLAPERALAAVLATTDLGYSEAAGGFQIDLKQGAR
jgi:ferric-dicitrate binding protein FerR (iron transport regulator)